MTRKPVVSASLSDIREDTIVLTGSMSLVATALFGDSGRLMKFLQSNIPASAVAADHRYRQWVFALSKAEHMRLAQRVAERYMETGEEPASLVFPRRIPSWRAHLRGDRAYLIHLDLVPRMLGALKEPGTTRLIKDPSLRFDPGIPWEVTIDQGSEMRAVWRDTQARAARAVKLVRNGTGWRIEEDKRTETGVPDPCCGGPEAWLGHFLREAD
ncbi:MAG: hypothetical protein U0942_06660 [Parvibaculum sp.]|uniref:hypothetical protein n=1 Tax=Parvibaculum sp. TaxID=2024848 RepID=UPI002ABC3982|nr:hypothetical protein [Parvibaculum sp.]MDZ4381006.1 hypothetical protein [Parvibaculum sp.]